MIKRCLSFILITLVLMTHFSFNVFNKKVKASEEVSFYSEKNKPIFYGATKITIDKDVVQTFDVKDSRFRIFAKDYEDGDITHLIKVVANNVNPKVSGEYEVRYEVVDSHNNKAEITVPVIVREKEEKECVIVRTVYAIPKMENMSLSGMERCNNGDRQILGIYLPEGAKATIKALDYDLSKKFEITFFNNTRSKNSFFYGEDNNTQYEFLNKVKDGNSYDSVPLITSPRLDSEEINKVYNFELTFDDSAKALDYYHYLDNENEFKENFRNSKNSFSVVEGEAILFVVPFSDIDKITKVETLDKMLEYYLEVVNRMDEMVGLSFNPNQATDRNYRTKYTAVCDYAVSAGAYYGGGFIAVCSPSIEGFFQYGWGSLHEIAHGYQGNFGRGIGAQFNMCLNETGNNVLAHYIQIDKELYKKQDDWMGGPLENIEAKMNEQRLNGKEIFHNLSGTYTNVNEKLYFIINLLDSFESEKTYGKMFSYYRKLISEYGNNKYTIPEVYAKFFSEEYKANIIPYLKAWGLELSSDVEKDILSRDLETYLIPSSVLSSEELSKFKEEEKVSLSYGLEKEEIVRNYGTKKDITIKIDIDEVTKINKKTLALRKNGKVERILKLSSLINTFSNLDLGLYELYLPNIFGYKINYSPSIVVSDEGCEYIYSYEKIEDFYHPTKIFIRGVYPTLGYSLSLSSNNTLATIALGGANLGNQNEEWKNKPDEVFTSVKILGKDGNIKSNIEVKGNGYFSDIKLEKNTVSLEYGDKIIIYSLRPQNVLVYSEASKKNTPIEAYSVSDNTIEYEVTFDGLKLLNKKNFVVSNVLYDEIKDEWIKKTEDYLNNVSDEEISNININFEKKNEIYSIYNRLKSEDKLVFKSKIEKILYGGMPIIKLINSQNKFKVGEEFDLYSFIIIEDNEDLLIESNEENVTIASNIVIEKSGKYKVKYIVKDSDNNSSSLVIDIELVKGTNYKVIYIALIGVAFFCLGISLFFRKKESNN